MMSLMLLLIERVDGLGVGVLCRSTGTSFIALLSVVIILTLTPSHSD